MGCVAFHSSQMRNSIPFLNPVLCIYAFSKLGLISRIQSFGLVAAIVVVYIISGFIDVMDQNVNTTWSTPRNLKAGRYEVIFENNELLFSAGTYYVTLGLSTFERSLWYMPGAISFVVLETTKIIMNPRIARFRGTGLVLNQMTERFKNL